MPQGFMSSKPIHSTSSALASECGHSMPLAPQSVTKSCATFHQGMLRAAVKPIPNDGAYFNIALSPLQCGEIPFCGSFPRAPQAGLRLSHPGAQLFQLLAAYCLLLLQRLGFFFKKRQGCGERKEIFKCPLFKALQPQLKMQHFFLQNRKHFSRSQEAKRHLLSPPLPASSTCCCTGQKAGPTTETKV